MTVQSQKVDRKTETREKNDEKDINGTFFAEVGRLILMGIEFVSRRISAVAAGKDRLKENVRDCYYVTVSCNFLNEKFLNQMSKCDLIELGFCTLA